MTSVLGRLVGTLAIDPKRWLTPLLLLPPAGISHAPLNFRRLMLSVHSDSILQAQQGAESLQWALNKFKTSKKCVK